jgi:hypothetical protein
MCLEARCVSMCNPPCPANQACVDGTRCELPTAAPAPYEPPPPPSPPKSFAERTHSMLGFHLGFGGSVEADGTKTDLVSTLGFNIREDFPLARYVLIGPLFQFGAWRPDVPSGAPDRSYYVDIDLFVRGRIPIELESIGLEVWGGVPIGLSLSFLGADAYPPLESFGFGWNVGVLFGGAIHFSKNFGMFTELGWLQHRMNHDRNVGQGSVDFLLAQGNFNIGFVFSN